MDSDQMVCLWHVMFFLFISQLERAGDGFSVVAEYYGRGVFNKVGSMFTVLHAVPRVTYSPPVSIDLSSNPTPLGL